MQKDDKMAKRKEENGKDGKTKRGDDGDMTRK